MAVCQHLCGNRAIPRRDRDPVGSCPLRASRRHDRQRPGADAMAAFTQVPLSIMRPLLKKFALCSTLATWLAAPVHAEWVRRVTDGIMGTRITVELWADDKAQGNKAIDAVLDEMRHIDDSMSVYKPTSEVSQVNAKAADGPMRISKER